MSKNYFVFDENKCVGCEACIVACVLENGMQFPEQWRNIYSSNVNKVPNLPLHHLSLACNHCDDAPCMKYCPSDAYYRDSVTNAIIIDSNKCMGCNYCQWNCPYEAPKYNQALKVIEKCNFCNSRLKENKKPACACHCPVGALDFSFDEIDKAQIHSRIEVPVNPLPSLIIKELENKSGPVKDNNLIDEKYTKKVDLKIVPVISAKKEYPLLIFTFVTAMMVSISASQILTGSELVYRVLFLLAGTASAAVSLLHLGNVRLFWRSVINLRNSWLSREVFFFSVYMILSITDLLLLNISDAFIIVSGLVTLLSIDMVYKPLQWNWKSQWHSGQVFLISISLFLFLTNWLLLLACLILIRLAIYYFNENHKSKSSVFIVFRFALAIIPIAALYFDFGLFPVILLFIAGELSDRIMFYNELELITVENLPGVKS